MDRMTRGLVFSLLLCAASPTVYCQLRYPSSYLEDRINTEQTLFTLKDENKAVFRWASEWTDSSAYGYSDKSAIFVWHFKDGSVAYSRQGKYIGDAGKLTDYLICEESSNLESLRHNTIQPLSPTNFPVKVELWAGEAEDSGPFKPETLIHSVCLDPRVQAIEYNRPYRFSDCRLQ